MDHGIITLNIITLKITRLNMTNDTKSTLTLRTTVKTVTLIRTNGKQTRGRAKHVTPY